MPALDQLDPNLKVMSFGDHLDELRHRLILAILPILPLMVVMYFFRNPLLNLIIDPLKETLASHDLPQTLQVLSPAEALLTQIKVSIVAALIIALPWIIWQLWLFIRPGLYGQERRFIHLLIPGSTLLTFAGISLFYYVMLPLVFYVLVDFGIALDSTLDSHISAPPNGDYVASPIPPASLPILEYPPEELVAGMMWLTPDREIVVVVPDKSAPTDDSATDEEASENTQQGLTMFRIPLVRHSSLSQEFRLATVVNFVLMLAMGMVIAFQTPMVMLLLSWVDLMRVDWLVKNRGKAVMGCAILGAVLTPADPWSMLAMMIPLYLLFELGIVLMRLFPASKVASGEAFRIGESDKPTGKSAQTAEPESSTQSVSQEQVTEMDSSDMDSDEDNDGAEK